MMPEIPEQQQVPLFRAYLLGCFRLQRRTTPEGATAVYAEVSPTQWGKRRQAMRLLMVLLARPGRRADKDFLLELFWPDTEPEVAAVYLTQTVAKLRKVLRLVEGGESLLIGEYAGYRLAGQKQLWMDADAAETLLNQASGQGTEALPLVQEAVMLLQRGTFLEEAEGTWVLGRRGRLADLRKTSQIRLAQLLAQQDRLDEAETQLFMLLEEDQTDEDVLSALMVLLHQQGMTHQALRAYQRACEAAAREEVELTEATRKLAAQLARSDRQIYSQESLTAPSSPTDEQNSPFSGIIETVNTSKGTMQQAGTQDMEPSRRYLFQLVPQVLGTAVASPHVLFNVESWERLSRALHKPSIVDENVLGELETIIGSYWRLFYSSPSPDLLDGIFGFLQTVTSLLERSHPTTLYQRLCAIASKTTLLAGRIAFDQHHDTAVDRYYLLSHQTAQKTGDATLEAIVLARMASVLMEKQQLERAISLLQEARRLFTRGPYTATVHAWLATQEAETWALMHQEVPCLKALEMAERDTDTIVSETDLYGTNFDRSLLSGFKGVCYLRLQKPEAAHKVLQDAISLALPSSSRQTAIFFSDLAATFVQRKEPEEACSLLGNALELLTRTKSTYVMQRLLGVRSELEEWSQQPCVKRLDEQLLATQRNVL